MLDMFLLTLQTLDNDTDETFLRTLYTDNKHMVYGIIMRVVRSAEAEDLTQDVFVRIIPKVRELRAKDERKCMAYLAAAAKNRAYDYLSHKGVVENYVVDDPDGYVQADANISIEDDVVRREDLLALLQVWPQLSDRDRYLLRARYVLRQTDAEIGAALNVKTDSVRTLVIRARKTALRFMKTISG